ncbi:phosphate uptake regulator PhoU [Salinadaptatus halalkaliphilus]|uniref:Phosphate uptake regulator PhoU n=1 Tax=Salinadaptatus halalkaliphilus TaxID=2419781 RepID=A0A4S3TI47_9EURY|nr:phosphate uptake regulator PhoU [Salinadaptatus halalkaliphilus]THE63190.1 phosphate uptake regulator PhoU [Salinadaptatus halalkaliphilus]
MSQNHLSPGSQEPVERKVQIAGNSTFVVSLPKEWATAQGLESGTPMYLYPHDDRLVAAASTVSTRDRTRRIDVDGLSTDAVLRRARTAYVAGCDRITVAGLEAAEPELRRQVERAVARLIGITIQEDTADRIVIRNLLDASEVSLPQTVTQARQLVLEMYADAIESLCTDDTTLARRVIDRDDDVDRLFAFVSRGFHRGLEDVHEINRLGTDRSEAFRQYRIARDLERIADHAEGIATITTRQSGPPDDPLAERLESVGADARTVVRQALEGEIDQSHETASSVRASTAELDQQLYAQNESDAYLYGTAIQRVRRTAANGINIATAMAETSIDARE